MSFKELKEDFDEYIGLPEGSDEAARNVFTARALFEIAGNLDSIAVSLRELKSAKDKPTMSDSLEQIAISLKDARTLTK